MVITTAGTFPDSFTSSLSVSKSPTNYGFLRRRPGGKDLSDDGRSVSVNLQDNERRFS